LYVNAAVLIGAVVYLAAGNSPMMPAAVAQQVQPRPAASAATAISMIPVQMSANTWGCYVLDADAQVLCVYQYVPGERMLRLQAARNIAYDKKLGAFNTAPLPREVADLVQKEATGGPSSPPASPSGKE
jgi:hypothetical protein